MVGSRNYRFLFIVLLLLAILRLGEAQKGCTDKCGSLHIQFPFQLKDSHSNSNSSIPNNGFHLSCTDKHKTVLELPATPNPVKLFVKSIDYRSQEIQLYDPENCLPRQVLNLANSSILPFRFKSSDLNNISFFNCASMLFSLSCPILALPSDVDIAQPQLVSCTKLTDFSSAWYPLEEEFFILPESTWNNYLHLEWSTPNCSACEAQGKKCRLQSNGTLGEIECFTCEDKIPMSVILITTGVLGASMLMALVAFLLYRIYRYFKMKGEDLARVEKFLEDYQALKPTRFSYSDIKRITNHFKHKLGEGAHGAVFQGKLSSEIIVAVKVLNNTEGDGKEFINEVGTMGKIHHINVVRLLGFCADGFRRALVYDFFPKGSLQNFISPPDNKDIFLGWEKLQQIALAIAKGIEYLHHGCDHRILHFDINPRNVLLDDGFTPKITDFGLAKLCPKNQSIVSITAARGTLGYIAPEVLSRNFGNVSYKSDVYSYGMLLLEMVGGRKNTDATTEETLQVLYPEWIYNLLEEGDVHIYIEDEEDIRIAKKLAIVGLWCIQWQPMDRPSMKVVVQMLEGDANKLKVPPSPFDSRVSVNTSAAIPKRHLNFELEVIHELE